MTAPTCFECDQPGDIHMHHVVPRSAGGTKTVPLCERCHGLVHSLSMATSALAKAALARKRAAGRRTSNDAPFGWSIGADGDTLEIHNAEQETLQSIVQLRAGGMSTRRIAAHLDAIGTKPRGTRWHKTTIERSLALASASRAASEDT